MRNTSCPFTGSIVALVTPFSGGEIDYPALDALVDRQIAAGQKALVPCGSTGESATLTHGEHAQVVAAVVRRAAGRVPVIAGTGSNSTAEAIHLTREAEAAGATIRSEPTDWPYGERQYSAEDPGGHIWTFSQSIADVDPADWGGTLKE